MVEEFAEEVEQMKAEAAERKKRKPGDSVSQQIDAQNERRTDAHRATAAGTNRQYISDAEKIFDEHPECVEQIEKGENPSQRWTQARVAAALGVARNTVSVWFSNNIPRDKATKPDARVKLSPAAKQKVVDAVEAVEGFDEHPEYAEDEKRWTQAEVAAALGVGQQTVSDWFTPNTGTGKASKPDARVKLSPVAKQKVVEAVEGGITARRSAYRRR